MQTEVEIIIVVVEVQGIRNTKALFDTMYNVTYLFINRGQFRFSFSHNHREGLETNHVYTN